MQPIADADLFKVIDLKGDNYYDGQSYFHCIARLGDPDNGDFVVKEKIEIRNLNVKDFGYDVKKMLAEFKNMKNQISNLSGQYSSDNQFLDLWNSVKTLKEEEFIPLLFGSCKMMRSEKMSLKESRLKPLFETSVQNKHTWRLTTNGTSSPKKIMQFSL